MNAKSDRLETSIREMKASDAPPSELPSLEERARRLAVACRTAAVLDWNRRRAGLPDPQPAPWPKSTWEFLAKHARRFQ
jgi:hypothetical protein